MSSLRIFGVTGLLCAVLFASITVWSQNANTQSHTEADSIEVVLRTSLGDISIELNAARAPQTVENFLAYVDDNFYTDTVFHRVIDGFMIQGGGYDQQLQRKTTRAPISNEAFNGLRNKRYTIAMARTTSPHSATSQFFINTANNSNLDHTDTTQRGWGYTVFGRVTDGQDVVDAISSARTSAAGTFARDVPVDMITILGVDRVPTDETDKPVQTNGNNAVKPFAPAGNGSGSSAADSMNAKGATSKGAVNDGSSVNLSGSDDQLADEIVRQN